ncbi:MAG: bleomycin resistance protein [Candidatus Limnocylindria bacterium]
MIQQIIPILRVADAEAALAWYARLGFERDFEHRYEPGLPLYLGIRHGDIRLHLSEHHGDARPNTLVYAWTDDVDAIAAEFGTSVHAEPWAREIELTDPDGNRLRIGQAIDT